MARLRKAMKIIKNNQEIEWEELPWQWFIALPDWLSQQIQGKEVWDNCPRPITVYVNEPNHPRSLDIITDGDHYNYAVVEEKGWTICYAYQSGNVEDPWEGWVTARSPKSFYLRRPIPARNIENQGRTVADVIRHTQKALEAIKNC